MSTMDEVTEEMTKQRLYIERVEKKKREREMHLGKKLAWLLRHGATKEHLEMTPDGYVFIEDIANHPNFASAYNFDVLQRIVQKDAKRRFHIKKYAKNGAYMIRANDRHTLLVEPNEKCLMKIESMQDGIIHAIHATHYRLWPSIKQYGLKTMVRKHMHFAVTENLLMKGGVKVFSDDCQLLIYLDVERILSDGKMRLYLTANNLILCSGLPNNTIPSYYFKKAIDRRSGRAVLFPRN